MRKEKARTEHEKRERERRRREKTLAFQREHLQWMLFNPRRHDHTDRRHETWNRFMALRSQYCITSASDLSVIPPQPELIISARHTHEFLINS